MSEPDELRFRNSQPPAPGADTSGVNAPLHHRGRDPRYSGWLLESIRTGLLAVDDAGTLCEISPEALGILRIEGTPGQWMGDRTPSSWLASPRSSTSSPRR